MKRTADNAPSGTPILVWVQDINIRTGLPVGWKMGRKIGRYKDLPAKLSAEGMIGNWNIPTWHPLPPPPEADT